MSEEKFVGFFRLVEACRAPGCPVCRCVSDESRGYLAAVLYEQVTDLDTRRAIRASWGFCNRHTWMLREIAGSLFGAAIIYEDLVRLALRRTERLAGRGRPRRWLDALTRRRPRILAAYHARAACPACTHAADGERRYLATIVTFIDDGDLQAAYADSDGLCLPHLFAAVAQSGATPGTATLVDRTRRKWRQLRQDIAAFVSKHDYRNDEPFSEAEQAACVRAFEMLAGARRGGR
jgi:hypothetical protein